MNHVNVETGWTTHWLYFLLSERKLPVAKRPVSLSGAMVTGVPRSLSGDENETPPDYPSPPTPATAAQPTSGDPESSPNTEGGAGTLRVKQLFFFFFFFCRIKWFYPHDICLPVSGVSVRHRVTSCVFVQFCRLKKKTWTDLLNGLKQKPTEILESSSAARTSRPGPAWTRLDPPGPAWTRLAFISPSVSRIMTFSPREPVSCGQITLYFSIWTNWSGSVSWTIPAASRWFCQNSEQKHRAVSGRPPPPHPRVLYLSLSLCSP